MKRIIIALALLFAGSAFAQQPAPTPEQLQERLEDVIQLKAQLEYNNVALSKALREAQKAAAACKPEPKKESK